jgi:hypothetical protein
MTPFRVARWWPPGRPASVTKRHFGQRMGATVVDLAAGHLAMVSHPERGRN